jgi:hypothetical protein
MRPLVALLGALVAGCSSVTTLSGARTLEPGQLEFVGALSVNQNTDPTSSALTASGQGLPVGIFADLGGRIGVVPNFDVGWRVYTAGVGGDARLRFYRDRRLHLAVAPGFVSSPSSRSPGVGRWGSAPTSSSATSSRPRPSRASRARASA